MKISKSGAMALGACLGLALAVALDVLHVLLYMDSDDMIRVYAADAYEEFAQADLPVGTVVLSLFAGEAQGDSAMWEPCDGRSLVRSQYPDLYREIGVSYGKKDEQTFRLPDFRGLVVPNLDGGLGDGRVFSCARLQETIDGHAHLVSISALSPITWMVKVR